jgi:hypothetical protein
MAEDGALTMSIGSLRSSITNAATTPLATMLWGAHARSASEVDSEMRRSARDHEIHKPVADEQPCDGRVRSMEADSEPDGTARGWGRSSNGISSVIGMGEEAG